MKTLVVMNEKGGVGKTNLVVHAGWYFPEHNRTFVINLDQQANLSRTLQHHAETESVELFETGTKVKAVGAHSVSNATRDLLGVERAERAVIEVFRDNLEAMKDDYDVCIIDTPLPSRGSGASLDEAIRLLIQIVALHTGHVQRSPTLVLIHIGCSVAVGKGIAL